MQIYDMYMIDGWKHMSINDDSSNSVENNTHMNFEINAIGIRTFFLYSIVLKA